tara:strand:- start:10006 stop:10740 length:735 start_codon:yes stop_codon:yes gene_type:complete
MVSVDTVYQRVLALSNKEQRGYVTPQEFNLLANQAQIQLLESYFYDLNQFQRNAGNATASSDSVDDIEDKISIFQVYNFPLTLTSGNSVLLPVQDSAYGGDDMFKLEEIRHNDNICAQVTPRKMHLMKKGTFSSQPVLQHPVYIRTSNKIQLFHFNALGGFGPLFEDVKCDYIRMPKKVEWDYVVVNEKALYNANGSTNFEVHPSEEARLVLKVLELAGVVINKTGLSSYGKSEHVEADNKRKS